MGRGGIEVAVPLEKAIRCAGGSTTWSHDLVAEPVSLEAGCA